nr:MerR family transcriptional regulator [Bdellovibrionales bacterium]
PITGVKPYVLRFWETEFEEIAPEDSDSGQKLYARKDVEAIFKIKKLLFEDKMTIPEAKLAIKNRDLDFEAGHAVGESIESSSKEGGDKVFAKNMLIASLQIIRDIKTKNKW